MKQFDPTNHGPWQISANYCCGQYCYQVYRLRDKDFTDHSGNREYVGPVFHNEPEAVLWLETNKEALPS